MIRVERFFTALAELQFRRAGLVLAIAALLCVGAVPIVRTLTVDTSFVALLPQDKPSVRDLQTLGNRVGGLRTLTVAVTSPSKNLDAMDRFIREAAPRIARMQGLGIRSVDYTLGAYEDFVYANRHLYASIEDLRQIRDSLQERVDYEKLRRNPFYVALDDETPEDPQTIIDRMQTKASEGRRKLDRFPRGLYITPEHDFGVFFIRCDFGSGDNRGASALIEAVQREVDSIAKEGDLRVDLGGNVIVTREEYDAILTEVSMAGGLTTVLSMLAILIFFKRLRSLPIIGLSLIVPILLTFAFAKLSVGKLNTSTAFLGSIVFGNGVNPLIMWLARYFEERKGGLDVLDAMKRTHIGVWAGTLSAAATAATAYASLTVTDFHGFRDFGVIGAFGQLASWMAMILLVPAATAMWERFRPLPAHKDATARNLYGTFIARLVYAAPRTIAVISVALGIASLSLVAYAVSNDPLEYNFKKLKSERKTTSRARDINLRVNEMLKGTEATEVIVMVLPDRAQLSRVQADLDRNRSTTPPNYGRVRTIEDLLPTDQATKIPVLGEIRELLLEARAYATPEQQARIDEHVPPADIHILGDADLPEPIARRFSERDGTRGRLLAIERADNVSSWDGRYLMRWSSEARRVRLPDGSSPPLAGEATVFADMVESIVHDAPRTVVLSFALTVLLVTLTFRKMRDRLLTLGSLLLGISVMGGAMAIFEIKINFLNFIAIPIAFGLGVEYSVNVMRRFVQEEAEGNEHAVRAAIEETGGAVILCSMTTILGYVTLHSSASQAIQSFGNAGFFSEVACLLSAVIATPAVLLLLRKRTPSA
jgi:predicted RND superfamily exporter protein